MNHNAIQFEGDDNLLELHNGFEVIGNVVADGTGNTLVLDGAADGTFDLDLIGDTAQYRGFDHFEASGASTWTLTGASDTDWTLDDGRLVVEGTLGAVTVDGGVLSGSGTVGDTVITNGGVLAQGNSIGTLTVEGDLTFQPGAEYQVTVDPDTGASDRVDVTGEATLAGSVLHVGASGPYGPSSDYTILTADNGITGEFDDVTSNFAFLDAALAYSSHAVTLQLARNDVEFVDLAGTRNQRAAAEAVAALDESDALHDAVVGLSHTAAPGAFDALSGDSLLAGLAGSGHLLGGFSDELRRRTSPLGGRAAGGNNPGSEPETSGTGAWVQLHHQSYAEDPDGNTGNPEFRYQGQAVTAGIDRQYSPALLVGSALGLYQGELSMDDRLGSGDLMGGFLGAYARYQGSRAAYLRGDLSLGLTRVEQDRQVLDDTATSATNTLGARLAVETGLDARLGLLDVRLYTQLSGQTLSRSDFSESGAPAAALRVDASRQTWGEARLGADIGHTVLMSGRWLRLQGEGALVQAFGDTRTEQTARFRAGGERFTVYGADHDGLRLVTALGAQAYLTDRLSLQGQWRGGFSDNATDHDIALGLSALW
ncbi:autotransporter outer membrane beta-barrel domain-containing protein [Natronospirillum operosum]|uniref:autotransporter family protein n=1 Tax=Natronospirillum operosum TaxID=2759953 RepID=UPI001436BF61|nr:autotransporter outer membrane beta-barrel domain-containing protein [Natronospirillum operosum]